MRHLENLCKVTLALSLIVTYIYFMEYFIAKFSGNPYEAFCFDNRMTGWYSVGYWTMIICNGVIPQLFWFRAVRNSIPAMITIGFLGVFGMWFERYIIIMAASHDFLPSSWEGFMPTFWDCSLFLGSIGTFFTLLLIFIRFVPVISIAEVKMVMPEAKPQHGDHH
jgi:molybdopterin-containing oxidoreductase family membrane subunit